jgi:hypothetical protein
MVVDKSVVRSVIKKIVCNDRIIALKLKAEPVIIPIIQVYMPTSEYEDDEMEKLYDTVEEILEEDGNALDRTMWRNRFGRGVGPVVRQISE